VEVDLDAYAVQRELIEKFISGQEELPRLPSVTQEITQALARSDTSVLALSKLVARDRALSEQLLRYASSVTVHTLMPPETILDVVRLLGMDQVGRITLVHAIKSLFCPQSPAHKRLFLAAWERLILKASTSAFLAKALGHVMADQALLGSLLTEVGSLVVLSSFKASEPLPSNEVFAKLCRDYTKPLGEKILEIWEMDKEYLELLRNIGDWTGRANMPFDVIDVVNLGLYHSLKARMAGRSLPSLAELSAYQKLTHPKNFITDTNELEIVVIGRNEIKSIAESLH
jgi:HD-like signal output (HDOD) protein